MTFKALKIVDLLGVSGIAGWVDEIPINIITTVIVQQEIYTKGILRTQRSKVKVTGGFQELGMPGMDFKYMHSSRRLTGAKRPWRRETAWWLYAGHHTECAGQVGTRLDSEKD